VDGQRPCTLATGCQSGQVCDVQGCAFDAPGVCRVLPPTCDKSLSWVCGCDGRSYENDCERLKRGAAWSRSGLCHDATVPRDTRLDLPALTPDKSLIPDVPTQADKAKPDKPTLDKNKPDKPPPQPDAAYCNGCYQGTTCLLLGSGQQNETQCGNASLPCKACPAGLDCGASGTCVCRQGGLCPGCCLNATTCASPSSNACGSGGATCVGCQPTWGCYAGVCLPSGCAACAGSLTSCCDKNTSSCISNTGTKCGKPGDLCVDCTLTAGTQCKNGSCVPLTCNCKATECCDTYLGGCVPGNTSSSCGVNGEACKVCMDICNAAGQCVSSP
jgi:hypothetical protein